MANDTINPSTNPLSDLEDLDLDIKLLCFVMRDLACIDHMEVDE